MSREERVALERPGVKSVLAFFLLPQFWRSMGHFKHIGPVFTRTLALMLVQSGLLPLNHSAARHGLDVDGDRIGPFSLMGEAWFYLRTRENMGLYQWGMFLSLALMFACLAGSVVLSMFYFLGSSVAQAQLFQHPGPGATNIVSTGNTVSPGPPVTPIPAGVQVGFNREAPGPGTTAGTTEDLAISILDRVLRQPANGTGGSMQIAIGPMLGTYSTGVLVIASLVIFWSIMSIVIDSARTGQLGGGRHNMVWTPIRFVFALGILVPVGGAFNTGQILVMKLAEWGSNLGTNMWGTYVQTAVNPTLLGTGVTTSNSSDMVDAMIKALTCAKENNMAVEVALGTGAFPTGSYQIMNEPFALMGPMAAEHGAIHASYIREIMDQGDSARFLQSIKFSYGNESEVNLCGTVELPNPQARDIVYQGPPIHSLSQDPGGGAGTPFDVSAVYKQAVRNAEWAALNAIKPELMAYACHAASTRNDAPPADYPNTCRNSANLTVGAVAVTYNSNGCNPGLRVGGKGGRMPPPACLHDLTQQYTAVRNAAITAAHAGLSAYFANNGPFETEAIRQGWAGMGSWYYQIAGVNRTYSSSRVPETVVQGGQDMTKVRSSMYASANVEDPECSGILASIGCGWKSFTSGVGSVIDAAGSFASSVGGLVTDGFSSITGGFPLSGMPSSVEDGKLVLRWALEKMEIGDGGLLVNIGGYGTVTHPMAMLSMAGADIMDKAFLIYGSLAFISLFAGIPYVGGAVEALMGGPVGGLLSMIASFGLLPGLMLLYYVPVIPWLKVMFAVLAWIVSVIEAVVTVPIVALAHMRTDGEGLMGTMAKDAYITWLNLLLRPGLVVTGFVLGNAVFEAMILYMNDTYATTVSNMGTGGYGIIDQVINTYLYVFSAYALVNASFKLVDILPTTTTSWLNARTLSGETFGGESGSIQGRMERGAGELATGIGETAGALATKPVLMAAGFVRGNAQKGTNFAGGATKDAGKGLFRGAMHKSKGGTFSRAFKASWARSRRNRNDPGET